MPFPLFQVCTEEINQRLHWDTYTIHFIDYCPPWYGDGGQRGPEDPCASTNPLGVFSLWFKNTFVYGLHGRPPNFNPANFFETSSGDRRGSRGCLVAPLDHLKNLVLNVIFELPSLKNLEKVNLIRDHIKNDKTESVSIAVKDFKGNTPPSTPETNDEEVEADIRLFIIDTADSHAWPSLSTTEQRHPVLQLLRTTGAPNPDNAFRMVVDCTAKKPLPIYSSQDSDSIVSTLQPGDKVLEVYRHALHPFSEVPVMQDNMEGVIKDVSGLQCSSDYYWSPAISATVQAATAKEQL